jgi:hypothetical protein
MLRNPYRQGGFFNNYQQALVENVVLIPLFLISGG